MIAARPRSCHAVLDLLSYLAALTLLTIGDITMWATMAFPPGILVVSILILLCAHHNDQTRAPRRPGRDNHG